MIREGKETTRETWINRRNATKRTTKQKLPKQKSKSCLTHAANAVVQHVLADGLVHVVHVVDVARSLPGDLEDRPERLILALALMLLVHLFK